MAIAFDNATRFVASTGTTATFAHTVTGSNTILIVYCCIQTNNTLTATYNGVSMTQVFKQFSGTGSDYLYAFILIAPTTGSNNVVLTSGASTNWSASMALSYTGAAQSAQPDSFNSVQNGSGTGNMTVATTVVAANSWLSLAVFPQNNDPDSTVSCTQRLTGNGNAADSNGTVGTGSQSAGWHWALTDNNAMGIMSIAPFVTPPLTFAVTDSTAVTATPTILETIGGRSFSVTDSTAVTATAVITKASGGIAPKLTFRDYVSPYSALTTLSYVQSTLGGNNLPVLQGELSNLVIFRIYNNFGLTAGVAEAVNVRITTYDGVNVGSHLNTKSVVNQSWIRMYENGFGENSSPPGLLTRYIGTDTAVGGTANEYVPEYGSDGNTSPNIRAGSNFNGTGFIEIASYAEMPDTVGSLTNTFAVSVLYDWIS